VKGIGGRRREGRGRAVPLREGGERWRDCQQRGEQEQEQPAKTDYS